MTTSTEPTFYVDAVAVAAALARFVAALALAGHDPMPNSPDMHRSARAYNRALLTLCGIHIEPAAQAILGAVPIHGPLTASEARELLDQLARLAQLPSAAAAARGGTYQQLAEDRLSSAIIPAALP